MPIVVCPGIHDSALTEEFLQKMQQILEDQEFSVFPAERYLAYSAVDIYQWLKQQQLSPSSTKTISFIAFSAGVVGAIGAAIAWQLQGGRIKSFVAFDGWGMPLAGNFPIYRVSHDHFTHWSSAMLGGGEHGFYADPQIEHLSLWRSPDHCSGWEIIAPGCKARSSLIDYLKGIV